MRKVRIESLFEKLSVKWLNEDLFGKGLRTRVVTTVWNDGDNCNALEVLASVEVASGLKCITDRHVDDDRVVVGLLHGFSSCEAVVDHCNIELISREPVFNACT